MLILSRREGESIEIPELGLVIEVTSIRKSRVSIGIEAPKELAILRGEMVDSVSSTKSDIEVDINSKSFAATTASTATLKESACEYAISDTIQTLVFQVA